MSSMYLYPSIDVISLFLYCIPLSLGAVNYVLNDDINFREKTTTIHISEGILCKNLICTVILLLNFI